MSKTDVEWQALDARIAWMMGFEQKESHGEGALFWVSDDGEEYLVEQPDSYAWMDWDIWQPHKNVAQALMAADALMSKFLDVRYVLEYTRSGYWCILRNLPAIGSHHTSQGPTLAKASCLALEQWLDAQKELQDDPG